MQLVLLRTHPLGTAFNIIKKFTLICKVFFIAFPLFSEKLIGVHFFIFNEKIISEIAFSTLN